MSKSVDEDASILGVNWNYNSSNGNITANTFTPVRYAARRTFQGVSCPGYATLIAEGRDATTPMSATDTRVKLFSPGLARKVYTTGGSTVYETAHRQNGLHLLKPISIPVDINSQTQQSIRSKFYGIYETGPSTDLGVMMAELSETVQMLSNPYKKLTREVLKWYSRSSKTADRILRSPTIRKLPRQRRLNWVKQQWNSAYLETYFGMIPFMSEIAGIMSDLERLTTKPPLVQVSLSAYADKFDNEQRESAYISIGTKITRHSIHEVGRFIRGAYHASLSLDTEINVPGRNATVDDVLPALWEALPYSWLSEYVFNIGSVLAARQSAQSLQWAWLCETLRYIRRDRIDVEYFDKQPSAFVRTFDTRPGVLSAEHKIIQRSSPSGIEPPAFGLRHTPQTRIAALAAVAAVGQQRLDNLKRRRYFNELLSNLL